MSKKDQVIFVTGGTGFVGSHVIIQLLEQGYKVKAAVRTGKTQQLKATYPDAGDRLDVLEISDILDADLGEAFKGVDALVHVAAPLVFTEDAEYILKSATRGTENVIKQAIEAGIKKIVVTGSWASLFEPDLIKAFQPDVTVDETWWSSVTLEGATSEKRDHMYTYMVAKPLSEKIAWSLVEQHPEVDMTYVLPPIIYGLYVPHYPPAPDRFKLGTNEWMYHLIAGDKHGNKTYPRMGTAHIVDVRDVAKAHVLALDKGPLSVVNPDGTRRRKRLITVGGTFTWPQAAEYLKEVRPALRERLEKDEGGPRRYSCCGVDRKMTEEVIGMGEADMIGWKKCVEDTVDCLLEWEARVKAK